MKLLRVGPVGEERPAVLDATGRARDLSGIVADIDGSCFASDGLERAAKAVTTGEHALAPDGARVGAPNTVIGPYDRILLPRGGVKTDWEVELGVVIGRTARYLSDEEQALACVAGYVISNDVSERAFQLGRGGQWDKGKSCETFNPLGPWLVTADEVGDAQSLGMRLWVNREGRQHGNTKNMIFGVAEIVRYLSHFMVLEPGDLINTGTPAGVALGWPDPKPYLRPGDVVEIEIDGLGRQRQEVEQA